MSDVAHASALGPERPGQQGLGSHQEESGNRAILALLQDPDVADHVDLVITHRDDAYEVWAARGMIRFRRFAGEGGPEFRIVEQIGENPIVRQDHRAVATCDDELRAAAASGHPTDDPNCAFIDPSEVTYPHAFERIAQLFDSPFAPDLIVNPRCWTFGRQPGQHGALDVVQSRAPLAFAGPGVRPGRCDVAARHVDIAPTICRLMGFPTTTGRDWSGRPAETLLLRQDGRVLDEIVDDVGPRPERTYLVLFDGLSHTELMALVERDDPAVANLRRLLDRAALFAFGSTVNFPSITWPSHATILTGAWCGHHDIVNPTYYDRPTRTGLAPQAEGVGTERYLGDGVETLYEAFHRVLGPSCFTASIHEPQGRGADHAALERRTVGPRDRLKALTADLYAAIAPNYLADGHEDLHREAELDARGLAQVMVLFDDPSHPPPTLVAHELTLPDGAGHEYGPHAEVLRVAIAESDRRLGAVLDMLEAKGLFDSTLFVFTSDHGMAAQDTSLGADPTWHLERIGMKTMTGEPMVWLRDLAVHVERAPDGRTARIVVVDNDRDAAGEHPPVTDAEVVVRTGDARTIATLRTNVDGIAGFATPVSLAEADVVVSVEHPEFNPRHVRLDGTSIAIDLRRTLYGGG